MIVSVCCPGPSLRLFQDDRKSLVVAVNRAVELVDRTDYWLFMDKNATERINPDPTKVWRATSRREPLDEALKRWPWLAGRTLVLPMPRDHKSFMEKFGIGLMRYAANFSTGAAIAFAFDTLGADVVNIYGHDLSGQADADGFVWEEKPQARRDSRWEKERGLWQKAVDDLNKNNPGLKLNRIL